MDTRAVGSGDGEGKWRDPTEVLRVPASGYAFLRVWTGTTGLERLSGGGRLDLGGDGAGPYKGRTGRTAMADSTRKPGAGSRPGATWTADVGAGIDAVAIGLDA